MRSAMFLALTAWGASAAKTCENVADGNSLLQAKTMVRVQKHQASAHDLVKSLRHVASSFATDSAFAMTPEEVNAALGTADAALQTMFPMFAEQHDLAEREIQHALGAVQACHNEQPSQVRAQLEGAVAREAAARDACEAALVAATEAEHEACEGQGDDPNCLCNEARTAITDQAALCVVVSQTYAAVFCENHASCNLLEQCYAQEVEVYNTLRNDVEATMRMRQQEYRAAMQSQCLIGLITTAMLAGTPIDHAALVACDDVDVGSLTIDFPQVPPAPAECPALQSDDPDCVHFMVQGCPNRPRGLERGSTADVRCCSRAGDSCTSGFSTENFQFDDGSASQGLACTAGACNGDPDLFCHRGRTFRQAAEFCAQNGQRLCTRAEIEDQVCCGTGCSHDSHLIWVSDA